MIAVIIPCYRVRDKIRSVLEKIGPEVNAIYVVDDACPEKTADFLEQKILSKEVCDSRIKIIRNQKNLGVGGAVLKGFQRAEAEGYQYLVKLDGDGQMEPAFIPTLVNPLLKTEADYTKGNRFFSPEGLSQMPLIRLLGNAGLSFLTKLTTGLWNVMDPTNGYVAIQSRVFSQLDTGKISKGYFFETDLLFRLALLGAVVRDIPMAAKYADEKSSLSVTRALFSFPAKHLKRIFKRIFYQYFLRDFSVASVELVLGWIALLFSAIFGLSHYIHGLMTGIRTESGALTITTISFLFAVQMLLAFLSYDTRSNERGPLSALLEASPKKPL